jgi:hypothetical protein
MRECDRMRALLAPALYDELGEEEARRLHAHLDACPTCAAELAESRDLLARLSPDLLRPSPEARARLLEELRAKTAAGLERPRWRPTWQQALVGAVCLALVIWLALRLPTSRDDNEAGVGGRYRPEMPSAVSLLRPLVPATGSRVALKDTFELRWTPCEGAVGYEVSVVDAASGKRAASRRARTAQTHFGGSALSPGHTYRVQVQAVGRTGGVVGATANADKDPWLFSTIAPTKPRP